MSDKKDNWTQLTESMVKNGSVLVDPVVGHLPMIESVFPPIAKSILDKFKKED